MLPESRQLTLTPSDPVPSTLLNELQDCIIEGTHGEIEVMIHPFSGILGANWTATLADGTMISTGGAAYLRGLEVPNGATLVRLDVRLKGNASATLGISVFAIEDDGTNTQINVGGEYGPPAAAWMTSSLDLTVNTLAVDAAPYIILDPSAAGIEVAWMKLVYSKL